ncbi:MAG: pilin [Candidatus Pacebacteria bacterium]|nr:pilin [Candidatus Paceibacterota bacterium]
MKYFVFFLLILIPAVSLAQFYDPIVGVPGVDPKNSDFNVYINSIYALSIGLAALLAVIKIIIAGVKWMLTDVVTSKEEAKEDIKGALIGLLIILSAVLLISVINKDILDVDLKMKPENFNNTYQAKAAPVGINFKAGDIIMPTGVNLKSPNSGAVTAAIAKDRCEQIKTNTTCGHDYFLDTDPYDITSCLPGEYIPSTGGCIFRLEIIQKQMDRYVCEGLVFKNCDGALDACKSFRGVGTLAADKSHVKCKY